MTERQVTIKLNVEDNIGNRLLEIRKQRDALLGKNKINLSLNTAGLDNAQRAMADARRNAGAATRDLSTLGNSITSKAIAPLTEYQKLLGSALQVSKTFGAAAVTGLRGASAEFQKQKTLAQFWGTSGYLGQGMNSFKGSISSFLTGGGAGFTGWLKSSSSAIAEYRLALVGASAALMGFGALAALKSKTTSNYINSVLSSHMMGIKLSDKEGAEKWIAGAQKDDWSTGKQSRVSTFQTILSKNPGLNQEQAQKGTEDIEKYWFANQEEMKSKGFADAAALASAISAPELSGDNATFFNDKFGLGFSNNSPMTRLARLSSEAPDDAALKKAMESRQDVILSKRLEASTDAIGNSVLPVFNRVLNCILDVSDAIGSIPGIGPIIGWGTLLAGAATGGIVLLGVLGSLVPGLITMISLVKGLSVAQYAQTAASYAVAAAQWIVNAAMTANPLGIAIMAIVGLIAILYVLEKKFGVVSKAWAVFSNSSLGKGIFAQLESAKKLVSDIGSQFMKGNSGGAIKMALEAVAMASPIGMLVKLTLFMVDFMRKIWVNSAWLNKAFATGLTYWQKIIDFFTWLLNLITGMQTWLRDGLGITKSQEKEKLDKAAEKAGVTWDADEQQWYTTKSSVPAGRPGSGVSAATLENLDKLKEKYENTPGGFFEGIPGINELTGAIKALTEVMKNPAKAAKDAGGAAASAVANGLTTAGVPATAVSADTKRYWKGDEGLTEDEWGKLSLGEKSEYTYNSAGNPFSAAKDRPDKVAWIADQIKQNPSLSQANAEAAYNYNYPKMDRGGPITASGSLIGHGGEEMDPAQVVAGGKTTLERINEMVSGGSMAGGAAPISVGSVNIDVHIDRIEKSSDIDNLTTKIGDQAADKIIFQLRNQLEALTRRQVGYYQG